MASPINKEITLSNGVSVEAKLRIYLLQRPEPDTPPADSLCLYADGGDDTVYFKRPDGTKVGMGAGPQGPTGPAGPQGPAGPAPSSTGLKFVQVDGGVLVNPAISGLGSGAGDVCEGNDSRLSDSRTPTAHAASHQNNGADEISVAGLSGLLADAQTPTAHAATHKAAGGDAIKLDELAAPTDVTTLNASTTAHGLLSKLPGGSSNFLREDGTWAAPPGGSNAFPIGSVFISVVDTNPATLLGYGTWAGIGAGRVLIGVDAGDTDFDTVEETGGAKTVASAGSVGAPSISGATAAEASHTHGAGTFAGPSHQHNLDGGAAVTHTHTAGTLAGPSHQHNLDGGAAVTHVHAVGTLAVSGNAATTATGSSGAVKPTAAHVHSLTGSTAANTAGGITDNAGTGAVTGSSGANATGGKTDNAGTGAVTGASAAGSSHSHDAGTLVASAPAFTGAATSVVQPYITAYFWKRTA